MEITVEGSSTLYTATGEDGRYSITVPDGGKVVLHFYFMGFLSQEIPLAEFRGDTLDVVMEQDYMNLETVVVTGTRTPRLLKNSPILTRTPSTSGTCSRRSCPASSSPTRWTSR